MPRKLRLSSVWPLVRHAENPQVTEDQHVAGSEILQARRNIGSVCSNLTPGLPVLRPPNGSDVGAAWAPLADRDTCGDVGKVGAAVGRGGSKASRSQG